MNKILTCLVLTVSLLLTGCTAQKEDEKGMGEEVRIFTLTDLHYLSKKLWTEDTATFQKLLETNDGKMIEYITEIFDAFIETALQEKPDAVLFTGDITFNGEMISLEEVKAQLENLQEAGIEVLVIPGNHDIDYPYAESYNYDNICFTSNISKEKFRSMMKKFGITGALSADAASFSYLYPLKEDIYILALDANTYFQDGAISEETVKWAESALQRARDDGAQVICMTHQNVLKQNEILYEGYRLDNGEEISALLKKYGVKLNLSGHSHLQHTSVEDGLTDICTESIALYPVSYGEVIYDPVQEEFTYEKKSLGVYEEEAYERFCERTISGVMNVLQQSGVPSSLQKQMAQLAAKINIAMFTGSEIDGNMYLNSEEWQYWQEYASETFWYVYMSDFLEGSSY